MPTGDARLHDLLPLLPREELMSRSSDSSSPSPPGRVEWALATAGVLASAAYVLVVRVLGGARIPVSFDTYRHFYPNVMYTVGAVREGGLLWNPYQSCGSPFFATISNGVLYPGNVLFFLLSPDHALVALLIAHLAISGIGTYALCRELGMGVMPSWCGALMFQLGNASLDLSTWSPLYGGPHAWLPVSMLFCERTLRAPSWRNAFGLALSLTLMLLPGSPQNLLFAYQVIGLRVIWAIVCQGRMALRPAGFVAVGLVLPVLMGAVQLLPAIELARLGMRGSAALSDTDVLGAGALDWEHLRRVVTWRWALGNPLVLLPALFVANGLFRSTTRRAALFYLLTSLLYLALAFGPSTPLFQLYVSLPLTGLFRDPSRFLWLMSFTIAISVALGVEALSVPSGNASRLSRYVVVLFPTALLLGLSYLPRRGLLRPEQLLAIVVLVATLVAAIAGQARWRARAVFLITAVISFNLVAFPIVTPSGVTYASWTTMRALPPRGLMADGYGELTTHAETFAYLQAKMTPQERTYFVDGHPSYAFNAKTASLFRVPTVYDYEPQPTKRFAAYMVMMLKGQPLLSIQDYYVPFGGMMPLSLARRQLDLAAARYIVADAKVDSTERVMRPPLRLLREQNGLRIYENAQAMPRAFFVPHVQTVRDPEALLRLVAHGADLRQVAYVEEDPPSGFTGLTTAQGRGTVAFDINESTHIVLTVDASERGFVVLSDQYYPGWHATVNQSAAVIQRANYLFRLIEVPAGSSRVELRYRPTSLLAGALVSACTLLCLLLLGLRGLGQARRARVL